MTELERELLAALKEAHDCLIISWGEKECKYCQLIAKAEAQEAVGCIVCNGLKTKLRITLSGGNTIQEVVPCDCQAKQKTEAVWCGKRYDTRPGYMTICNSENPCPDCQAKANHVVQPHAKVSLPDAPDAFDSETKQWKHKAELFMVAVKQWIEAQGAKS